MNSKAYWFSFEKLYYKDSIKFGFTIFPFIGLDIWIYTHRFSCGLIYKKAWEKIKKN